MVPIVILALAATAIIVCVLVIRAGRRQEVLAEQWTQLEAISRAHQARIAHITHVYQHARRGSKALITWVDNGNTQDAWFWEWQAPQDAYVALRGRTRYGPHNQNPDVLYVRPDERAGVAAAGAQRAWQREYEA